MKFIRRPLYVREWLTYELAAILTGHTIDEIDHAVKHCGVSHKSKFIGPTEYKMVDNAEIVQHFRGDLEPAA